jgi:hypothetical protein
MPSHQDNGKTERFDALTGEIEAIEAEAEALREAGDAPLSEQVDPRRVQTLITTRDFVPGGDTAWLVQNVASKPRGTIVMLGQLAGVVHRIEQHKSDYKGKTLDSVWLFGAFEARIAETGEIKSSVCAILPNAFGRMIEEAFRQGADRAHLDIDIGVEATGRAIPYEWAIWSHMGGETQRALKALRSRQEARALKAPRSPRLISN